MGKRDKGYEDLLGEIARLITGALEEKLESEELQGSLIDINRRMSEGYGYVIGAMALGVKIVTIPVPGEKERGKKPKLSLNFQFGGSKEDKEMGKEFDLNEGEMNQLLKQAREESARSKDTASADAEITSRPPEETEKTAELIDPRNISEIINSIRAIARALSFNQRRLLVKNMGKIPKLEQQLITILAITEEQMKNDTPWLQGVQRLINEIQGYKRSRDQLKGMLLGLEELFKRVNVL